MKRLIGLDIGGYTFDPAAGTVTITGLDAPLDPEQLLLITNVTRNVMLYNFADPLLGAGCVNNVVTLAINTTAMAAGDNLQIFVEMADPGAIMNGLAERLAMNVLKKLNVDSTGRLRVGDAVITSGTVSTVSTVSTVTSIANWGACTATSKTQVEAYQQFQQGFRRNLVVT